jgi:hypothetical protein
MAVKKHRLEMAMDEDFCLLGLVSDESDYRLCWLVNRAAGMDLERQEDLELYHAKMDVNQVFPLFAYTDTDSVLTYRIIKNRAEQGFYLDELKNLDYLVHIQGEVYPERVLEFMKTCVSVREIRMCVPVDLSKIRNLDRLLLW